MNNVHSQTVSLIWNIADDVLRDIFVRGQYRDVILPMVVLRRLDALLEDGIYCGNTIADNHFGGRSFGQSRCTHLKKTKLT